MRLPLILGAAIMIFGTACGDRTLPGQSGDGGAARDQGAQGDAVTTDAARSDAARPDAAPGDAAAASCAAQTVTGCPEPCMTPAGVYWNGTFCQPIICCCQGPDCGATYATPAACLAARGACATNQCATTGGYCEYGDYVVPTCLAGYGKDITGAGGSGTCGLGVCCVPCPEASATFTYVAHSPATCATIDYACPQGWLGWENECGCGCRQP
jgi:hypothetical protein